MMMRAIQDQLDRQDGTIRLDDLDEVERGRLIDAVDEMGVTAGVQAFLLDVDWSRRCNLNQWA